MRFPKRAAAARNRRPPLPLCVLALGCLYCGREASPGAGPELCCVFAPAAALFAAHLALIAAASCSRRSGVRLSFLFALLTAPDPFTPPLVLRQSSMASCPCRLRRKPYQPFEHAQLICSWAWLPRVFLPLQVSVSVWQVSFRLFADELRADGSFC